MMLSDLVISVNVVGVMSYSLPSTKKGGGYAECSTFQVLDKIHSAKILTLNKDVDSASEGRVILQSPTRGMRARFKILSCTSKTTH